MHPLDWQVRQIDLLWKHVAYAMAQSKYYNTYWKQLKDFNADRFTLKQFADLPFTSKADLSQFNEDFRCVEKQRVADYVTTSGTTGDPITFYLTAQDLDRLAENEAQSMRITGANNSDVFQLITTIDKRFMAGIAYFLGTQKLGAGIVRNGPGSASFQWDSILRFEPTILIAIPSYIPQLIKYARENNIDPNQSSVKKIICIGEPIRKLDFSLNELGIEITKHWQVDLYSTYASTEMGAAFTECSEGKGGHLQPDLLYLEVLDENGQEVQSGEVGEVVVTPLGVEGMPLLRYRTGDICRVYKEPCKCGKTTWRLGPVVGRKNQMLKIKGTTLFPQVIYDVLDRLEDLPTYLLEVKCSEFGTDVLTVLLPDTVKSIPLKEKVKSLLRAKLRVVPEIDFVPLDKIVEVRNNPDQRKEIKMLDLR